MNCIVLQCPDSAHQRAAKDYERALFRCGETVINGRTLRVYWIDLSEWRTRP